MNAIQPPAAALEAQPCIAYVDAGTTTTRVWLMSRNRLIAGARRTFGVRDAAIARSSAGLLQSLQELLAEACDSARHSGETERPARVVACGMIGSPQGLAHVPHVTAPAGVREVAAAAQWFALPDGLPVLIVPGVRVVATDRSPDGVLRGDVMRGEETLCFGLRLKSLLQLPATVLSLGSHWKAIHLDADGRVAASMTTLSGELLHATQQHTLVVGSVAPDAPNDLAMKWFDDGATAQERCGLSRALFGVRLLDLAGEGTPKQRLAFLIGAFVAADREAFLRSDALNRKTHVTIVGREALAHAWKRSLAAKSILANVIAPSDAEGATLAGLHEVWSLRESQRHLSG